MRELQTPPTDCRRETRPSRVYLALAITGHVVFWMSLYAYVPVLPTYARDVGAPLGMIGLIVGAYGLTQLILRIPIGVWSDRVARRKPFLIGGMLANAVPKKQLTSPLYYLKLLFS